MVVVALRLPYDLMVFPDAPVYLCTYSILEPSMHALAKVMFGDLRPFGRLPVSIPGYIRCPSMTNRRSGNNVSSF